MPSCLVGDHHSTARAAPPGTTAQSSASAESRTRSCSSGPPVRLPAPAPVRPSSAKQASARARSGPMSCCAALSDSVALTAPFCASLVGTGREPTSRRACRLDQSPKRRSKAPKCARARSDASPRTPSGGCGASPSQRQCSGKGIIASASGTLATAHSVAPAVRPDGGTSTLYGRLGVRVFSPAAGATGARASPTAPGSARSAEARACTRARASSSLSRAAFARSRVVSKSHAAAATARAPGAAVSADSAVTSPLPPSPPTLALEPTPLQATTPTLALSGPTAPLRVQSPALSICSTST
mmetsp:Transcript_16217/g.50331  ORF Transcript_16217/g.50331 Transcript_16217/m.50331 type:complete len:299 (+) Transcript_16217:120-1016(+)